MNCLFPAIILSSLQIQVLAFCKSFIYVPQMILLFMKHIYIFNSCHSSFFKIFWYLSSIRRKVFEIRACIFFSKGVVLYCKNIQAYLTNLSEFFKSYITIISIEIKYELRKCCYTHTHTHPYMHTHRETEREREERTGEWERMEGRMEGRKTSCQILV